MFSGGVTTETEDGQAIAIDNSEYGAVGCTWLIFASLKPALDTCYPEETDLRKSFNNALEKIKAFIIANSMTPISASELDADLNKRALAYKRQCDANMRSMVEGIIGNKERFEKSMNGLENRFPYRAHQ